MSDYTLSGRIFGELTVLEKIATGRYSSGNVYHIYKCRCSCGSICEKRSVSLVRGDSVCCHDCSHRKVSKTTKIGNIPSRIKCSIRYRSDEKGIPFDVDDEYLWNLYLQQDKKCALTGVNITFGEYARNKKDTTASLDRIDSSKGYTKDNVQWVHKHINKMKLDSTEDEFINWCRLVANHVS